ncbi:KHG/KDPG aldolase [Heracleum sosnowskyi]|uniref:KHG/KDPG aldolase n=1 Tax=Heracleum sosnowskyi TaxID=360622 RepID=A0AAD8GNI4_9APIA|nr:KHG/KDPG aldolase [Heracleum sosnowskyi]
MSALSWYACFSSLSSPPHFQTQTTYPPRTRNPKTYYCKCNTNSDKTLTQITSSGVIACLRANSAELAVHAACAALDAGISVLEIVVSTPGFLEVLQHLVKEYPTKTIGAGTVLSLKDAKGAIRAGAKFLMSPATVKEILDYVHESEALYIPGAMTPTEIFSAHNSGAKIVKVYPVSALGGICYIEALQKPFSHIPMVASQGIAIDHIEKYITKGASSVVLSDAIFNKEAMLQQNFSTIDQLARLAVLRSSEAVERMREFG